MQATITWTKKLGKSSKEWKETCLNYQLPSKKLKTLVKIVSFCFKKLLNIWKQSTFLMDNKQPICKHECLMVKLEPLQECDWCVITCGNLIHIKLVQSVWVVIWWFGCRIHFDIKCAKTSLWNWDPSLTYNLGSFFI